MALRCPLMILSGFLLPQGHTDLKCRLWVEKVDPMGFQGRHLVLYGLRVVPHDRISINRKRYPSGVEEP
jgi:hypothetical protein